MQTEATSMLLDFGERQVPYRLHRQTRRSLRIIVSPDLSVSVYAPLSYSEQTVAMVVRKKAPWIARSLDRMQSFHPLPSPKHYVSGETFMYLGRQYRLRVQEGRPSPCRLYGRFLSVTVRNKSVGHLVRRAVEQWYVIHAAQIFAQRMTKCHIIAGRHGVSTPQLIFRRMRTRWGSCTRTDRITLNIHLIQTPIHCVDYVIMHELCHMTHHNHSRAFYSFLARCMPDWQQRKQVLNQISLLAI